MRIFVKTLGAIASVAACQLMTGTSAQAADLASRMYTKAPPMAQIYSWTGFYVGAHVGGAWSDTTLTAADAAALTATYGGVPHPSGVIGGGQIGYNHQFQNVVLGIELAGGAGPGFSDRVSIPGVSSLKTEGEYFVMLGGRIGYAFDRWLPYFTAGGAWGGNKADAVTPFGTGQFKNDHTGYFAGGGVEYAFLNNFSVGVEYRYIDFDRRVYGGVSTGSEISSVSGRVNYRF